MQFSLMQASVLWRKRVTALAAEYPDVELSHMYVDNAAMQLVRDPKQVLIFPKLVSIDVETVYKNPYNGLFDRLLKCSLTPSSQTTFLGIYYPMKLQ